LLTGFDQSPENPNGEVSLYVIDYLAALSKTNYGAHGYASNFILSVMDREWRKGMKLPEALEVAKKCIHELHTRFVPSAALLSFSHSHSHSLPHSRERFLISQPVFVVKVVDKDGTRVVDINDP
jgi:20S proteasome subunit beta 4